MEEMKGKKVLMCRHAKTNGGDGPKKDCLSEEGIKDALAFVYPEGLYPVTRVQSSCIARTYTTAGLILNANGSVRVTALPSNQAWGDFGHLKRAFGWDLQKLGELLKKSSNCAAAFKTFGTPEQIQILKKELLTALMDVFAELHDGEAGLVVSHMPFFELLCEAVVGLKAETNCPELGWVIFSQFVEGGPIIITGSSFLNLDKTQILMTQG